MIALPKYLGLTLIDPDGVEHGPTDKISLSCSDGSSTVTVIDDELNKKTVIEYDVVEDQTVATVHYESLSVNYIDAAAQYIRLFASNATIIGFGPGTPDHTLSRTLINVADGCNLVSNYNNAAGDFKFDVGAGTYVLAAGYSVDVIWDADIARWRVLPI